jgi:BRCT domain type II-containing protein
MIAGHRLCLLTLVVLLAATQTLQATTPKPDRGLVRFTDNQHIPVRPKAATEPAKPKSSSPTKSKKPSAPAQAVTKKKTPVKPPVAAAAVKSEYTFYHY